MAQLDLWGQLEYDGWEDSEEKVLKAPYAKLLKDKDLTTVFKNTVIIKSAVQ